MKTSPSTKSSMVNPYYFVFTKTLQSKKIITEIITRFKHCFNNQLCMIFVLCVGTEKAKDEDLDANSPFCMKMDGKRIRLFGPLYGGCLKNSQHRKSLSFKNVLDWIFNFNCFVFVVFICFCKFVIFFVREEWPASGPIPTDVPPMGGMKDDQQQTNYIFCEENKIVI